MLQFSALCSQMSPAQSSPAAPVQYMPTGPPASRFTMSSVSSYPSACRASPQVHLKARNLTPKRAPQPARACADAVSSQPGRMPAASTELAAVEQAVVDECVHPDPSKRVKAGALQKTLAGLHRQYAESSGSDACSLPAGSTPSTPAPLHSTAADAVQPSSSSTAPKAVQPSSSQSSLFGFLGRKPVSPPKSSSASPKRSPTSPKPGPACSQPGPNQAGSRLEHSKSGDRLERWSLLPRCMRPEVQQQLGSGPSLPAVSPSAQT